MMMENLISLSFRQKYENKSTRTAFLYETRHRKNGNAMFLFDPGKHFIDFIREFSICVRNVDFIFTFFFFWGGGERVFSLPWKEVRSMLILTEWSKHDKLGCLK